MWINIENLFRFNKDSRAIQLENQLRNITIGDLSASTYFSKIKTLSDQIENLVSNIPDKNLVMYALNGLSMKFQHVASIIQHRSLFPMFLETHDMITLEEQTLTQNRVIQDPSHQDHASSSTILYAARNRGGNNRNPHFRNDHRQPHQQRRH